MTSGIDVGEIVRIADEAGEAILQIYATDHAHRAKSDNSPLTEADIRSHEIITARLRAFTPEIPILSEEGLSIPWSDRSLWKHYWLVDPLDGTKEFLKRNGEFTVNLALVHEDEPLLGVITAPAKRRAYWADKGNGAFKRSPDGSTKRISVERPAGSGITVVESRSHPSAETETFLQRFTIVDRKHLGSSLKFCSVAEGESHLYPRLGPMMAWDIAAGMAIAQEAGAVVTDASGKPIRLHTESLRCPSIIVSSLPVAQGTRLPQ